MAIKGVIKNSVTADISAEQFASLFQSIYGKNGICNVYEKLQCVKIDNNTVRLSSGVYNLSGYMVMVENGTNEDFVIDSGTAGLKRNDLLIAEFVRNGAGTGVDVLTFKIIKGTSVVGAASDPALTVQDISAEGTTRQEALYRIMIDGTSIVSVVPVAGSTESINSSGIVESGFNENGTYIKFGDGTMICRNTPSSFSSISPISGSAGGITTYRGTQELTFPQPFLVGTRPAVEFSARPSAASFFAGTLYCNRIFTLNNEGAGFQVIAVSTFDTIVDLAYIAVGRWKE